MWACSAEKWQKLQKGRVFMTKPDCSLDVRADLEDRPSLVSVTTLHQIITRDVLSGECAGFASF